MSSKVTSADAKPNMAASPDPPRLVADRQEMERFVETMFPHAEEGSFVSLRTFEHRKGARDGGDPADGELSGPRHGDTLSPIVTRRCLGGNRP